VAIKFSINTIKPSILATNLNSRSANSPPFWLASYLQSFDLPLHSTMKAWLVTVAALASTAIASSSCGRGSGQTCRCLPGDTCWPAAQAWSSLNSTVNGRLVATVPIGSPCHDPNYDAAACSALQSAWNEPQPQYVHFFPPH